MAYAATAREIAALLSDAGPEEALALSERYAEDPRKQVRQAVGAALRRRERELEERERVSRMYALERELGGEGVIVGVDEVGRGALAGPLTACAVALPGEPIIWGLNDSKQLSPARRGALGATIAEHAIAIGVAHVEPASIDAVGMSVALRMAMGQAIADAGVDADCVLIDGNPVHVHPQERALVKGDARVACIAAASIVAKVTRDSLMVAYDSEYPGYHLAECKGYGSPAHIDAIRRLGLTPIHRVSFCGNFLETPALF
ncbi:RNase HII [Olsenella uli DSM 7084]|uniref:Ribonuclease HII n=1 Tax=Olsenella uli (strain ATCC 49627 / DSM 7084 / CCUG 31166 / CIP 109912 / JCM 12494 / LMG 11480 / NCIMB 702895 / VPI D76D-27C) TaxID=633147 RepID=E1R037_OLSUV|nr:ribonuclease HII [Olsenella uli]ADK68001.1 RNase HII [Olsenella uli DSM 7084]EUB32664.1 ribonuclease HII [Olsenella uli MSTE5]KRO13205.1 RNase HII [Olsenella uli DSM 7084]